MIRSALGASIDLTYFLASSQAYMIHNAFVIVMRRTMLVLYASETGSSHDLAEQLWREGNRRRVPIRVRAFDDFNLNVRCFIISLMFSTGVTIAGHAK